MSSLPPNIAVGYVRVSTTQQVEEGHSLEVQQKNIMDYCFAKKLQFHKFYVDPARSGKDTKREYLQLLLSELKPGMVVIVVSISRLSRSTGDFINISKEIKDKGASLVILDQTGFDIDSAVGRAMISITSVFSQLERDQTSDRVSNVLNSMSRDGRLIVKPRFGWKIIKDGKTSLLVEDPDEQAVINIIRELIAEDPLATRTQLAKKLNNLHIKIRKSKVVRPDYLKKIIADNDLQPKISLSAAQPQGSTA